jgi:hypothetical protein
MTEFHLTRSKDIELYIGNEQLFGVTDFRARAEHEAYPIREYLSGEPVAIVNGKKKIELRMSVLSLFRYAVLDSEDFTLSLVDGDTVYSYEGCIVTVSERNIAAGKNVADTYVITAKSMRKQVLENAG